MIMLLINGRFPLNSTISVAMVQTRYSVPAFTEPTLSGDNGNGPPFKLEDLEKVKMYPELKHYRLEESYKVSQDTRKISIPLRTTEGIRPFSPGRLSDMARPVTAPVGPVRPIDLYRSRHEFQDRDSEGKPRQIDLRLSMARETFKPRLPPEPTHVCRSDFPEGICGKPQNIIIRSLEKRAKRESLNYSTTQRKINLDSKECSINYPIPLKIFGNCKPIVLRTWERPSSGWTPRQRAQSAPPYSRPGPGSQVALSEFTEPTISESEIYDSTLQPNYECECYVLDEPDEELRVNEGTSERLALSHYLHIVGELESSVTYTELAQHLSSFTPGRQLNIVEIEGIRDLLDDSSEMKVLAALCILERLSTKKELGEMMIKEFFMLVLRKWVALINSDDCPSKLLNPIINFIENVTHSTHHDYWLDDVYKEQIVEQTTAKMTFDGTRARCCTLLLRVFSDSPCCANILANTALPECMMLPQVKQTYWDDSEEALYLDEDIFLQEEILKIFCNIAHSSSFGRKVLICHAVIETISRVLVFATCPVQYQAALLCSAICADVTGVDHVTSKLTNERADEATCVRHLANLFTHSKCLKVKAASGAALLRLFSTQNRSLAHRGLKMVHDVVFPKTKPQLSKRPKTAPPRTVPERAVNKTDIKDMLQKYMELCTSKGAFADPRYFRCRLMALEAVYTLLHFPLKKEGRSIPFHADLAKSFFAFTGSRLFRDLKKIAEKHRYVKILQDKIQKIQINLIKKTKRNVMVSQILDRQLQEIESDNSVLKIPGRDFEMARNELVYCETVIKILSLMLTTVSSSLNLQTLDSGSLLDSTRRYNSQYTTLQDSLYNKYALSVLPGRVNSPSKPAVGDNSEQHLALVRRLLTFQVVETLVPWLYCVYPPITEKVVRCLSSLFTFSSVHSLTLHCDTADKEEPFNVPDFLNLQPSDVAQYMKSTSVTPKHISNRDSRPVRFTEPPRTAESNHGRIVRPPVITIPVAGVVKPVVVVEQCTHHIGHLCSGVLTQNLLICNNHTVSRLTAQLLRDIAKSVTREQLLCMVDDYLLEKLTEYIILCNGDEERIFVALDILETLIEFQPTLGKLYNTVGGLNTLVAKLLGAASEQLKQKLLKIINSLPNDDRWCQANKVDCVSDCKHIDVWHKVTSKWENQDNVSKLMSVEL
ncbi:uncharacterized protein LOC134812989 isoform X2 [Bolinopsis microptera]|uniref:uncharacterized protein LOC134812989 isoform X2 n=1 Tax=Bolinopsis microptera TaxID=2820187 RepID=UPI003078DDE1